MKPNAPRALLIALCLAVAWPAAGQDLKTQLDREIDRAISEHRIVGTVVMVARDGQVVFHRAAGLADREDHQPTQESTIFRLASMSKPIVTAAALALVERGTLKLEDPVTRWLPSFQPALADGTRPVITIGHLLTHTAGLSYGFLQAADGSYHKAHVSDGLDQPGLAMDEELGRIVAAGLAFGPGTKWSYSVAIDVLGAIVAKAYDAPLPEALAHLVTGPLTMKDTAFTVSDKSRLATPYVDGKPEPERMTDPELLPYLGLAGISFVPSRVFNTASFPSGGAGLVGTAGDYLHFLEAMRTGTTVLKPATVHEMMTAHIATGLPGFSFGYGGAVLVDAAAAKTPQTAGTWTWSGIYGTSFFIDPAQKLSVVALTNTTLEGLVGAFPKNIRDAIYESLPH